MEVIYKAFDGTIFNNEYACKQYECDEQKNRWKGKLITLGENGLPIDYQDFQCTYYLGVFDQKVFSEYVEASNDVGIEAPPEPGLWAFEDGDSWMPLEDKIQQAQDAVTHLMDIEERLKGG